MFLRVCVSECVVCKIIAWSFCQGITPKSPLGSLCVHSHVCSLTQSGDWLGSVNAPCC